MQEIDQAFCPGNTLSCKTATFLVWDNEFSYHLEFFFLMYVKHKHKSKTRATHKLTTKTLKIKGVFGLCFQTTIFNF